MTAVLALLAINCPQAVAARSVAAAELPVFASALSTSTSPMRCSGGATATAGQIEGLISDIDPAWASIWPSSAGADCGIESVGSLMHFGSGVWSQITTVGPHWLGYCVAAVPAIPPPIGEEFGVCGVTPPGVAIGFSGLFPNGEGWGEVKPKTLFNGGAPSGLVTKIKWKHWGSSVAIGYGRIPLYMPRGGYYKRLGRIKLRASALGTCQPGGQLTYTLLRARVPKRPGGRLGRWFKWSGYSNLCEAR